MIGKFPKTPQLELVISQTQLVHLELTSSLFSLFIGNSGVQEPTCNEMGYNKIANLRIQSFFLQSKLLC